MGNLGYFAVKKEGLENYRGNPLFYYLSLVRVVPSSSSSISFYLVLSAKPLLARSTGDDFHWPVTFSNSKVTDALHIQQY